MYNRIITSKNGETWFAILQKKVMKAEHKNNHLRDDFYWSSVDSCEAENFLDLQKEIGNKNWIEILNKND